MIQHGHNALLNYIDDLIYDGLPANISDSYTVLLDLLQHLGLEVSDSKLLPPSTCVTCLGIQVELYLSLTKNCKILKPCVNHGQIWRYGQYPSHNSCLSTVAHYIA